jgi:hypothetical protein
VPTAVANCEVFCPGYGQRHAYKGSLFGVLDSIIGTGVGLDAAA